MRKFQQADQAAEVPSATRSPSGFQLGRVAVPGEDVRVGVLLVAARSRRGNG
jgi:hypothetical protein